MNLLNSTLNSIVAGTAAFAAVALIGEILPTVDPKFLKPEIFAVAAVGSVLLLAALKEGFSIHDNLH